MASRAAPRGAGKAPPVPSGSSPEIGIRLAAAVFFGLSIVYFFPAFLPGQHIFGTDYLAGGYFFYEFVSQRLAEGELPKWVPYIYGGLPHLANPGSTFYPVRLLADFIFPVTWILPFIFLVQFGFAGLGMYLLARELGCRSWVAFVTGLAFQFTGISLSWVYAGHDGRVIAATFAPLVFYCLHRGIRTGSPGPFVGAAATIGFSLLSFQIQSNYYLLVAGLIWAIFCLLHLGFARDPKALGRRVALGVAAVAFGFVLAAVNFLPFLDYIEESPRGAEGGRGYDYSVSFSMPPAEITAVAIPEIQGVSVQSETGEFPLGDYRGQNPFKLHTEYLGALVVTLFVLGFRFSRGSRYWWFFAGLGLFTLTIAFGGNTPIYRLYYELLPGTNRFRAPSISFFIFSLSAVAMAAITLERLAAARDLPVRGGGTSGDAGAERLQVWLGAIVGVLLLATAFTVARVGADAPGSAIVGGFGRFTLFTGLLCGAIWLWWVDRLKTLALVAFLATLTVADLWLVGRNFFQTVPPPEVTFAPDDVVRFLQSQPERSRVWVLPFPQAYRGHGNYLMHFGIEQAGGESGNQLQRYNEFAGAGTDVYVDWHNYLQAPAFMAAANIRYIIAMVELETPFLREVHRGSAIIYENATALPRAYLVEEVVATADSTGALTLMAAPGFDPAHTAVVYTASPPELPTTPLAGGAQVVESTPDRVVVRTTADRSALLVLADNYFDGWTARVNGVESPILRTNHTFRGVVVGAGESEVVFEFRPRELYTGLYIYLAGMGLLLAYAGWLLLRARRVGPKPRDEVA